MIEKDRRYTVVVLYPQRLWHDGRPVTYTAHVASDSPHQSIKTAIKEAHSIQPSSERGRRNEWIALVAFKGHLDVQAWGT